MKDKGFTLIEVLAVIVILSLLALLSVTSVTKIVKENKETLYDKQLVLIKSAAETWGADNINKLPNSGECKYITVLELKEYGLLDSNIVDPRNNEPIKDDLKIKIESVDTGYGTLNTNYEISSDISNCTPVYEPTCIYFDLNSSSKIDLGDKVRCNSEYFYVVDNTNGRVSMLSEFNLNVGNSKYTDEDDLIQSEDHMNESNVVYRPIKFSNTNYWTFEKEGQYVYSSKNTLIGEYLDEYKNYLKDESDVRVVNVSLMNLEQATILGYNYDNSTSQATFNTNLSWVNGYYWLGFAYSSDEIIAVSNTNAIKVNYDDESYYGVRPIVEILESDIKREVS